MTWTDPVSNSDPKCNSDLELDVQIISVRPDPHPHNPGEKELMSKKERRENLKFKMYVKSKRRAKRA